MEGRKDLGVQTKRLLKRITNKNKIKKKNRISSINFSNIFPDFANYLKSDSYFYSHFISSSHPSHNSAPFDAFLSFRDAAHTGESILANKGQMKERLVEYLKSDTYLYTPLESTRHCDNIAEKSVISSPRGQELRFTRVTSTVLSDKIAWQTKEIAENSVVEKHGDHGSNGMPHDESILFPKTPALQEVKKQAARRSSRLSTFSG
ncbi:uncharacterized protein LOC110698322 [Chenopodium quinoa]|uniref:uncharacterized protein LOC110698322 n=1 Tax=Chenopodium quinoa TaxID=63459 RepID=UPI000B773457|nr:uncharacterized protein LOC110698322 [Chenopodium quinoa]